MTNEMGGRHQFVKKEIVYLRDQEKQERIKHLKAELEDPTIGTQEIIRISRELDTLEGMS